MVQPSISVIIPFLKGMITEIRANAIGMMTLVALAISISYIYSVAVVFGPTGMDFFWELAASKALESLIALLPSRVHIENERGHERHGQTDTLEFAATESGDWFFHCHILYHCV